MKTNYTEYLKQRELQIIPENEISDVIHNLYDSRKDHIQSFIKESLKKLYESKGEEYPGDLLILNILVDVFSDDALCKNRLTAEIQLHQQKLQGSTNDYSKLL